MKIIEYLFAEKNMSSSKSLIISVRDINYEDKNYSRIQIRINKGNWIDIPINFEEKYCAIHIYDLQNFTKYEVDGRILSDNNLYLLNPLIITTQPNHEELGIKLDYGYKNKSGASGIEHKTPNKITLTVGDVKNGNNTA